MWDELLASDKLEFQAWSNELENQYHQAMQKVTPGEIRRLLLELRNRVTTSKRERRYQKLVAHAAKQPLYPRNLCLLYSQIVIVLKAWEAEDRQTRKFSKRRWA